jgi:hypothetical protein
MRRNRLLVSAIAAIILVSLAIAALGPADDTSLPAGDAGVGLLLQGGRT